MWWLMGNDSVVRFKVYLYVRDGMVRPTTHN